ncbi:sensor histidine kinase [Desulfovibrio ferrophilus]|uniref:histidine kinase n=1 Tax=Desulfovibrio ferrophilus TaxID=241368 RepID=A0A2Z6B357_9BACT|nr:ATP-binding protein [Desulfovibrio ferrophilus]BBD09937.1 multi-sensor signal transduction histidine kinase [Desulfovibrio ferrophilus]
MPASMTFRTRLLLAFAIVIILALLLPTFYARQLFKDEILDDAQAGAIRELRLASLLIEERGSFPTEQALHTWLTDLGSRLDARITYLTKGGRVIADSHVSYAQVVDLDNHANRPEITQAEQEHYGISQRYSATLDKNLIYAATRIEGLAGIKEGFLRLSVPYASISTRLERLQNNILLVFGLALGLSFILSMVLTRSIGRSVAEMSIVAKGIGEGDYNKRLRFYPGTEFEPLAQSINTMAASIESQIATISRQANEVEGILDGMREGLMVLDASGRIAKVNRALTRIFPDATQYTGRRPLEIVLSPELQDACDRALANNSDMERGPWSLQIEPDRNRIYDVNIVRLDTLESGSGAIIVFHDISELKRLERVRRDFVANVSHELRTPLTTIKGYSETILTNKKTDPQTSIKFLEVILKNADHMAQMVEDLLSLSRLESGKQQFSPARVNAADALNEAFRTCDHLAGTKRITLSTTLPEEGVPVRADFDRLVQVFRNLVENAVKYSPEESSISVDYRIDSTEAIFGVSDLGPGIPKEDTVRIFERFYRVEKHRAKSGHIGSSGLGLAICKHIVERLGGRIWVENRKDADTGSTFYFSLPAENGQIES